jgi:ABC-type transporter Mla subunit MlaD
MKKLRQRITLNDVSQAINSLKEQNLNSTADNILAEIIRSSNGTVGGSKGTVLKFKRQLESTDSNSDLSTVKETSKGLIGIDEKLISTLEVQLWTKLEARLDNKLREQLGVHQVSKTNEHQLEEMLQEMRELWLDSVTKYISVQAQSKDQVTQLKTQLSNLQEINKQLGSENQELGTKLEALQQLIQTKDEELEELSLENNELKLRLRPNPEAQQVLQTKDEEIARLQSTLDHQLNQNLRELHELWLEAVFQIPTATPSTSASVMTETNPLETYFQALTQLHSMTPAQKYDYAMKLFEQGMGPSEVSRILAVNKGSLQHYKEGKRKRPEEE